MKEHRKHLNIQVHNIAVQPNMFDNKRFKQSKPFDQNDWYGIEYDTVDAAYTAVNCTKVTRIGNMDMHRDLPIQSKMRRCLLSDDGTVNYYTHHADSNYKENGVDIAVLDGTDGQFMVEIPEHYVKFESDGTKRRVKLSPYPLSGFTNIPKCYVSAVHATLNRSNNKLSAVINKTETYRGGNNSTTYDVTANSKSGSFSLLGKPVTYITLTNFRTYARNRGYRWNCYDYNIYQAIYYLYLVEYADRNSQADINNNLTAEGFRQGGLGVGVNPANIMMLLSLSGSNPFVDCGVTTSLGNNTGELTLKMPFSYDSNGKGNYGGEYDVSIECVANKYYSLGEDLYKCIQTCTGINTTNTSYFTKVTRGTYSVNSYRGIENPFAHIENWLDGILVRYNNYNDNKGYVYVCEKRSSFASTLNSDYVHVGNVVGAKKYIVGVGTNTINYVKNIIFPNLLASDKNLHLEVGYKGYNMGFCDEIVLHDDYSTPTNGVLLGYPNVSPGMKNGLTCFNTDYAPSSVGKHIGTRLCFL